MDQLKGLGLGVVIGGPLLAAVLKIVDWAGKAFVPWLMIFMSVSISLCTQETG